MTEAKEFMRDAETASIEKELSRSQAGVRKRHRRLARRCRFVFHVLHLKQ